MDLSYSAAKDATVAAIERRARLYRNCVVVVCAVSLGTVVAAFVFRSGAALVGLVLLAPVTGCYLLLDARAVRAWQSQVLEAWRTGMSLRALAATLSAHPFVPRRTLDAMLETLPPESPGISTQTAGIERAELIRQASEAGRRQSRATALGIVLLLAVLCGIAAFVTAGGALAIFGIGSAAVLTAWRSAQRAF